VHTVKKAACSEPDGQHDHLSSNGGQEPSRSGLLEMLLLETFPKGTQRRTRSTPLWESWSAWKERVEPKKSSKKSVRVTKSSLAAEIMATTEACDEGHWFRHILEQLLGLTLFKLPLAVITDSESLSAALRTTNNIQAKRSRIEVKQLREDIEQKELELLWVPGGKQVADVLTKEVSSNLVERIKQGKVWWKN
jgi:hypothetical protein